MTDASFFVYLFASCTGVAVIALLLLIFKMQQGKTGYVLWRDPLFIFVVITFFMGLFYFGERFYTDNFAARTGWSEAERFIDLILYFGQLVSWYWFVRSKTGMSGRKLTAVTNAVLICMFSLQLIIYLFFMNVHYYIPSPGIRTAGICVNSAFIVSQIILMTVYCRGICQRIKDREEQIFLLCISLLLLIDLVGETIYVILLFQGSPLLEQLYYAFDGVSILFLLINILTALYIYRCGIQDMMPVSQEEKEEEERAARLQVMEEKGLSKREQEVTELLLDGQSYDDIADALNISKYTVKRHAHNIYQKLEVANKVDLIARFR